MSILLQKLPEVAFLTRSHHDETSHKAESAHQAESSHIAGSSPSETRSAVAATQQPMDQATPVKQAEVKPLSKAERACRKARQEAIYKFSAIAASAGVCATAIGAIFLRTSLHMIQSHSHSIPLVEITLTMLLIMTGVVGMEMWARWAHKALWHDFAPGWALHHSHHAVRTGPFEANDVFAVINAAPAFALCLYGFLTPSVVGTLCFGAGMGITLFGMMYMFIHDGMVHQRFPVGPIAQIPFLQRVAAAHTLHHAKRYKGVPWGMFLGPQELEAVGGREELDALCKSMYPPLKGVDQKVL